MMKKSSIAVTGSSGFVGSHVSRHLMEAGYNVLPLCRKPECGHHRFDLSDTHAELAYLKDCDAIVHCAARIDQQEVSDLDMIRINAEGTRVLFEKAKKFGVRKFINISTGAVYGEGYEGPIHEDMPCKPNGAYAISKLLAEAYCKSDDEMLVSNLRVFFPFGRGQKNRLVPNLAKRIRENTEISLNQSGKPMINPVHINVLTGYIEHFIQHDHIGNYNISGDTVVSIEQLAILIGEAIGYPRQRIKLVSTDKVVGNLLADNSKVTLATGLTIKEPFYEYINQSLCDK